VTGRTVTAAGESRWQSGPEHGGYGTRGPRSTPQRDRTGDDLIDLREASA
jgi:hypothetical protein